MADAYTKEQRLAHANELIKIIARHGRRFFFSKRFHSDRFGEVVETPAGRVAMLVLRNGRVYHFDEYTGKTIYTHWTPFGNDWRGFSHGGTLRSLVEKMRDYVMTGEQISLDFIAPTMRDGKSNLWGYGREAAYNVRTEAAKLPIIKS